MAIGTLTLDTDWAELTDPDDVGGALTVVIDGAGAVELIFAAALPVSGATGFPISEGTATIIIPNGMNLYARATSGSADIYWAEFAGIQANVTESGYTYNGDAGADHDAVLAADIEVGFDNLTTRDGANPYEFRGYLITDPAGVASGDSVDSAILSLAIAKMYPSRTIRVYGLEYNASQSSSVTDWSNLNGLTKTTAFVDIEEPPMEIVQADITAIVAELQGVSGWTVDSPIQLILIDQGSAVSSIDARMIISRASRQTCVTIMMADGGGPSPPDPGTGGP